MQYDWRMMKLSFKRHRFPPEIIHHSVWLYARFTLSFRDIEDLLADWGFGHFLRDCPPLIPEVWNTYRGELVLYPSHAQ